MAEFTQQETQEEQTFKSKISPFARKLADPTPVDTTVAVGHEIEMWNQVSKGILAGGVLVDRYQAIKDKVVGDEIISRMNDVHLNEMLNLAENLHQTDMDHLDLQDTVWAWDGRNNDDTPFMIGKAGSDGKPSKLVKGKPFEDYDVPHRQRDRVKKHYDNLEETSQKYILDQLPAIMVSKAKFHIATITDDLNTEASAIISDQHSYTGGMGSVFLGDEHLGISDFEALEPGQIDQYAKVNPLTNHTEFTLNLTPDAENKLRLITKRYDDELAEIMAKGVLSPKEAIAYQREFTLGILNRQFKTDAARDPDGTFLKVIDQGYKFHRDFRWGRGREKTKDELGQKQHIQTIKLTEKYTEDWMRQQFISRRTKHTQEVTAFHKENQDVEVKATTIRLTNETAFENENNTYETVQQEYINTGIEKSKAMDLAWNWELKNRALEAGVQSEAHSDRVDVLTYKFITDLPGAYEAFSTTTENGGKIAKPINEIHENLLKMHETLYLEKRGITRDQLTAAQRKEIKNGVKLIKKSDIQKLLNNEMSMDISQEKTWYENSLRELGDSEAGREWAINHFFAYDQDSKRYYIDQDLIRDAEGRKAYRSNKEFSTPLMPLLRIVNEEHRKKLEANPGSDYLGDKEFEKALNDFSTIQTDMVLAISIGSEYIGPDASIDQFEFQATKFAEKNPAFKKIFEDPNQGLNSVLTPLQRRRMNTVRTAFEGLMAMEVGLTTKEPIEHIVKVPLLSRWRDNILHNKNKKHYANKYSRRLAMGIKKQLDDRIISLGDRKIVSTIAAECSPNGVKDQTCIDQKWQHFGITKPLDTARYGNAIEIPEIKAQLIELLDGDLTIEKIREARLLVERWSTDAGGGSP